MMVSHGIDSHSRTRSPRSIGQRREPCAGSLRDAVGRSESHHRHFFCCRVSWCFYLRAAKVIFVPDIRRGLITGFFKISPKTRLTSPAKAVQYGRSPARGGDCGITELICCESSLRVWLLGDFVAKRGCQMCRCFTWKATFLKGFSWAEKIAAVLLRVAVLRDCRNRSYPRHSLRQMQGRILHGFSYYSQFQGHQIVIPYYSI